MDEPRGEVAGDGREVTAAAVGSLEIFRLRFPPSFAHGVIDPPKPYLAVVIDGAVRKTFRHSSSTLARGSFMSIPAGAAHSSVFAGDGCQVVILRTAGEDGQRLLPIPRACTKVAAEASALLGWQIAKELECRDACSPLALEGLALELLACAGRADTGGSDRDTPLARHGSRSAARLGSSHRCRSTSSGKPSGDTRRTSPGRSDRPTA